MAAQFMVGIWEYHVNDLDEGLIKDVNEYLPYLTEAQEQVRTQQLRVIPIGNSLAAAIKVMPYEQAEEIIKQQSKIVVAPASAAKSIRWSARAAINPWKPAWFSAAELILEGNGIGRSISQQEALDILQQGIDAGLVLQPGNAKKPSNICMCRGCCCQILKMLKRSGKPAKIACTSYYAVVDEERCINCGNCEDKCQMEAIIVDEVARVDLDRCIGCGLCIHPAMLRPYASRPKTRMISGCRRPMSLEHTPILPKSVASPDAGSLSIMIFRRWGSDVVVRVIAMFNKLSS